MCPPMRWKVYWPAVKLWMRFVALICFVCTLLLCVFWTPRAHSRASGLYTAFMDGEGESVDAVGSDTPVMPDGRMYAKSDTRYKQSSKDKQAPYNLIVSTYMRSGSTLVGKLFELADEAFYTWEPLWLVSKTTYYRGNDVVCSHHTHSCARIGNTNNTEFMVPPVAPTLRYLQSLLDCSFQNYPEFMIPTPHRGNWIASEREFKFYNKRDWQTYKTCRNRNMRNLTRCLEKNVPVCLEKKYRVVKVLRMSLYTQGHLLATNLNLKIIHLVRDPRAIISSHIHTPFYEKFLSSETALVRDIETLCDRIRYDIEGGQLLGDKYPNRFRVMHYEDTGDLKQFTTEIFNFIGLSSIQDEHHGSNETLLNRLFSSNNIDNSSAKGFHPVSYRTTLPWKTVNIVDTHCRDVLQYFGYTVYENESHLRDLSRPAYRLRFSFNG